MEIIDEVEIFDGVEIFDEVEIFYDVEIFDEICQKTDECINDCPISPSSYFIQIFRAIQMTRHSC